GSMVSLERLIRMRGFRLFRTFRRSLRVVGTLAVGHLSVRRGRSLSTSLILAECILRLRLRRCFLVGRTFRRTWLVGRRAVTRPRPWHRWAATCSRTLAALSGGGSGRAWLRLQRIWPAR